MHGNAELELAALGRRADLLPALGHALEVLHDDILNVGSRPGIGAGKSQQAREDGVLHHDGEQCKCHETNGQAKVDGKLASMGTSGINMLAQAVWSMMIITFQEGRSYRSYPRRRQERVELGAQPSRAGVGGRPGARKGQAINTPRHKHQSLGGTRGPR